MDFVFASFCFQSGGQSSPLGLRRASTRRYPLCQLESVHRHRFQRALFGGLLGIHSVMFPKMSLSAKDVEEMISSLPVYQLWVTGGAYRSRARVNWTPPPIIQLKPVYHRLFHRAIWTSLRRTFRLKTLTIGRQSVVPLRSHLEVF